MRTNKKNVYGGSKLFLSRLISCLFKMYTIRSKTFLWIIFLLIQINPHIIYGTFFYHNNDDLEEIKEFDPDFALKEIPGMLNSIYDRKHPYYIKYCATTKVHPYKNKGIGGSIAGHGLFYLKGVCKKQAHGLSDLSLCPEDTDLSNPNAGVGISVNKGLRNTNFIAVPSLRVFLAANIYQNEELNFETKERIVNDAIDMGVFKGVSFHDSMIPNTVLEEDKEEYIARYTFGSDYAISMARNLYCINLPTNAEIMSEIADNLNKINVSHKKSEGEKFRGLFFSGRKKDNDYHWNVIYENCLYPGVDSLSKVCMIKEPKRNKPLIIQMWNIPVPANILINFFERANNKIILPKNIYSNEEMRRLLLEYNWLPYNYGVLVESIKIISPNHLFKEDDSIFIMPNIFKFRGWRFNKIIRDTRYSVHGDDENLFKANYQFNIIRFQNAVKRANKELLKKIKDPDYIIFLDKFRSYFQNQLDELKKYLRNRTA